MTSLSLWQVSVCAAKQVNFKQHIAKAYLQNIRIYKTLHDAIIYHDLPKADCCTQTRLRIGEAPMIAVNKSLPTALDMN